MKICPECKRQFENTTAFCAFDGRQLSVSTAEDPLAGLMIDYKYQLHERIARGGTGSVYTATHMQLNMPIAVKIMHQDMAKDPTAVERFRREAYAAMEIRHPNAIAVMDFGVTPENLVYVVMERLKGKTLRDRLKENRYPSLTEINDIMQQICAAVEVAHKLKIIHRDLKPENIFIDEGRDIEVVKVLDFGIAKFKGLVGEEQGMELTRAGFVVGTPYYMSPEQCYGKDIDARADIYSLGIMLYELLAGRLPFLGRSHTAVAVKQAREKPTPIYEIRPNVPAVLNAVVMHALEKKPADRPADIRTFSNELAAAMKAVTESEFMKVFSEASEQDLEAAVLLTTDPTKFAEASRPRRKKKISVGTSPSAVPELLSANTEMDEQALDITHSTMEFVDQDAPDTVTTDEPSDEAGDEPSDEAGGDDDLSNDQSMVPDQNAQGETQLREAFYSVAKESDMLLQIILGDLEKNGPIDQVFLSELKSAVDQLRSTIFRLQQSEI